MKIFKITYGFAFVVLLIHITTPIQAQQFILTGKITSREKGSPIANTSVTFVNTTIGTLSDNDGNYKIWTKQAVKRIQFSANGFEKLVVLLDTLKSSVLNIELKEIKLPSKTVVLKKKRILSKSVRK